ncbi:hypothetical protein ACIRD3_19000 [Kitasatospora sp. NPDC093550]|uniref:hypothetical protein n=1 Tax=Kitasatospora sp. NPDC093550 TaxID=3364089 RepID=UPI00381F7578
MSGTAMCIHRVAAGIAERGEAPPMVQGDSRPVAHAAPDGDRSARYATRVSSPAGHGTEAVRRTAGRLPGRITGRIAGPGSTESPHVVRPVPENR